MIRTIIFDIGNVLMRFDWHGFIAAKIEDRAMIQRIEKAMFGSGIWAEIDLGFVDEEEAISRFIREDPEITSELRMVYECVGESLHRLDYAIPWIKDLKSRGYQVLFLSNYSHPIMEANPACLDFLPYMDGGIFSCDVHLIKPDPAIYRTLLEKYRLVPEECIFLDDTAENINAANALGIHGIVFENYEQGHAAVESLLDESR